MPRRGEDGVYEVCVSWRSQASTLLQRVPPDGCGGARSRPKSFLVASGAEAKYIGGKQAVTMRGSTVLPDEYGGRTALLWLLASGHPLSGELVALASPGFGADRRLEIQGVRVWQRTLRLPRSSPITADHLQAVNRFRAALSEVQRRRYHRLAGTWDVTKKVGPAFTTIGKKHVECLDIGEQKPRAPSMPRSACEGLKIAGEAMPSGFTEAEGRLSWADDDTTWARSSSACAADEFCLLAGIAPEVIQDLREAARNLLWPISSHATSDKRWPKRLVPLRVTAGHIGGLAPFDIGPAEMRIAAFRAELGDSDAEESDDDSGPNPADVDPDTMDEDWMWTLADHPDFSVSDSIALCFDESPLALPTVPICWVCGEEGAGVKFSKAQLTRRQDERECEDCVRKRHNAPQQSGGGLRCGPSGSIVEPTRCMKCRVVLTSENCSKSQKQKTSSRRLCIPCVNAAK